MRSLLICCLVAISFSCTKYIDDVAPADPSKRWLGSRQNSNDTIAVRNGYVYLTTYKAISASGTSIVSANKLKGDFELKIKYSSFITSGSYSFSDQLIFNFSNPKAQNPLIAAFLTNEDIYLQDSLKTGFSKPTANREGELYMRRTGGTLFSWIRAGSDTLFLNKVNYYAGDLGIEMQVYSSDDTAVRTAVHIDDIMINGGGGGVSSNAFEENTIDIVQ
jgi:hypothetical protein